MKIQKADISDRLENMKGIILAKSDIDALKGALLKNNTITAYNLEVGVTASLDVHTDETFILPARAVEMIESLPDGTVEITANAKNVLTIKMDSILHKVQSFPAEEFPEFPEITSEKTACIPFDVFKKSVNSILYAVSTQDKKPVQKGVLFEAANGFLNLVACDGRKLAWQKLKYDGDFSFVVPKPALQKIINLEIDGDLQITFGRRFARFVSGEYTVFTRLLEGEFVDYEKVIPNLTNRTLVDRKKLLFCLQRVLICQDTLTETRFSFSKNELELSITGSTSQYRETVSLSTSAQPVMIGFDGKLFLECLKSCESESVEILLGKGLQPAVMLDGSLTALLLPVRLKEEKE